jgi:hypothetical protein
MITERDLRSLSFRYLKRNVSTGREALEPPVTREILKLILWRKRIAQHLLKKAR